MAAMTLAALPSPLHAESNAELSAEIKELRAQIHDMKAALSQTRAETRKTQAKIRAVASRPAPVAPIAVAAPYPALPPGAVPAFVTASKQLQFGSLTITPGGFFAAESVFRTRTIQSDINSAFTSIPFGNNPLAHTNEFRFTSRQSRIALLAEGAITPTFVAAGYAEFDFLAAANTANENQANGFNPRVRQLYGQLDNSDYGMHVVAGQIFSLATLNSKGITPRNEVTPPSIDGQYIPGFVWARQPGIRLTKDFGQKLWLSISAEESQSTFAGGCAGPNPTVPAAGGAATLPAGTYGNGNTLGTITCGSTGTGGGFGGDTNVFSLNHVPDVIAKAAYEARLADRDIHAEVFGMYRDFYDRVSYTDQLGNGQNANHDSTGYGVGGGLIIPLIPRRLDFQASVLYGRGIGRYGTSTLSDTTFNADGSLKPIQEAIGLTGLTLHVTPSIDIYGFTGIEREFRTYGQNANGTFYGQGAPYAGTNNVSVQGCNLEANLTSAAAFGCSSTGAGNTKQVFEVTGGFWDKVYKGSFGEVRAGVQYAFAERQIFNNIVGGTSTTGGNTYAITPNNFQPKAFEHTIMTSLRYYPFQ